MSLDVAIARLRRVRRVAAGLAARRSQRSAHSRVASFLRSAPAFQPTRKPRCRPLVDGLSTKVAALKRTSHVRTAGRSHCRRRGLSRRRTPAAEIRRASLRRPKDSTPMATAQRTLATGGERARTVDERPVAVDDDERRARLLFAARRLGAALHPDDAGGLRCVSQTRVPARHLHARPRRHRARAAVHDEVDDWLHVEAVWCRRRSLHAPALRPLHATRAGIAGEIDGLEAIESVAKAYPIDRNRIVMAGFSMGGASAWSYTVHYADRWVAAAPGAGFSETRDFLRDELARQPQNAVQQTLWHLYDATDYAVNTFNLPVVAYSGANDGQKQAADAMAAAMARRRAHARAHHRAEYRALVRARSAAAGPGSARPAREPRPQSGAEGSSIHDLDAALQQDVLGCGRSESSSTGSAPGFKRRSRATPSRATTAGVTAMRVAFDKGLAPFAAGARPRLQIDGADARRCRQSRATGRSTSGSSK